MRFAYADPPYIGQAKRHYGKEATYAGEVDHRALLTQLRDGGYAGWALSLSSPSLEEIAHLCREVLGPNVIRWGAWVKPFAAFKPNVNPAYCWEPVAFVTTRKRERTEPTVRDFISANITMRKGLSGVKPDAVSGWLFDLMGMTPADTFDDLFLGSGAVTRAWEQWRWHNSAPAPQGAVR